MNEEEGRMMKEGIAMENGEGRGDLKVPGFVFQPWRNN